MFGHRPFVNDDSELVLTWRNSADVAAFMFRDDPITGAEHEAWFPGVLVDRPDRRFRMFTVDGAPSGLFSLSMIDSRHANCVWGGYLAPGVPRGAGLGTGMMSVSLAMAFDDLGLHRVTVEAVAHNAAAIALYEKVGFRREGLLRDRARQSHGFVDVVLLGLLRSDWVRS